ncbi:T9SS type A sorting domain-containing protein [Rhodocaloribacter sp.]
MKRLIVFPLTLFVVACMMAGGAFAQQAVRSYGDFLKLGVKPQAPQVQAHTRVRAPATVTVWDNRADFESAFPDLVTEDLEDLNVSDFGLVVCFPPVNENTGNECVDPGDILPGLEFDTQIVTGDGSLVALGAGFTGNATKVLGANFFADNTIVRFLPMGGGAPESVTAAGLDVFEPFIGLVDFQVYGETGALLAEVFDWPAFPETFFGVSSDGEAIAEIYILGGAEGGELADNVSFTGRGGGGDACAGFDEVFFFDSDGFEWCWDGTKVDPGVGPGSVTGLIPPLVCPEDGRLDAELTGSILNAYPSASTAAVVCRNPEGGGGTDAQFEAINLEPDDCVMYSDSFTYDGARDGHLSYSGTWTSFCFGDVLFTGMWSGTFDASGLTGPVASVGPQSGAAALRVARDGSARLAAPVQEVPSEFTLAQNYPNPFNPTTQIAFALPEGADVTLKVYNVLGREVATLVQGYRAAGRHQVTFDATDLSAGIYLYVIRAGDFTATKRMTLLK